MSVSEMAALLGTHLSTASRLASTLASGRLLARSEETGKYRLGIQLLVLGGLIIQYADLRAAARPILFELRDATKERVNLSILDGDEAVNIENVPGLLSVQNVGWVGRRTPLHCTASGKAMLAHATEARVRGLIAKGLPRLTPRTTVDGEILLESLSQVRSVGYAINQEEFEIGLCSVAAPIRDHRNRVEASISISGPIYRMTPDVLSQFGGLLRDAAAEISRNIGHAT